MLTGRIPDSFLFMHVSDLLGLANYMFGEPFVYLAAFSVGDDGVLFQARTKLMKQVRRLSQALKAADKGTPVRSGKVSRKTFTKALAKEGGLGRVGEAELTRWGGLTPSFCASFAT